MERYFINEPTENVEGITKGENSVENKKSIVLNDDELEGISGGLEVAVTGRAEKITTCDNFVCVWCGHRKSHAAEADHICQPQGNAVFENICNECEYLYSCDKAYKMVAGGVCLPPNG